MLHAQGLGALLRHISVAHAPQLLRGDKLLAQLRGGTEGHHARLLPTGCARCVLRFR